MIDDWQGRGVGTLLLDLPRRAGAEEGVARFTALLLAENREMLELLETIGPGRVVDRQSGTVEIEAELAPRARDRCCTACSARRPAARSGSASGVRARASRSRLNRSASACGSGTRPASARKPTVTLPA